MKALAVLLALAAQRSPYVTDLALRTVPVVTIHGTRPEDAEAVVEVRGGPPGSCMADGPRLLHCGAPWARNTFTPSWPEHIPYGIVAHDGTPLVVITPGWGLVTIWRSPRCVAAGAQRWTCDRRTP